MRIRKKKDDPFTIMIPTIRNDVVEMTYRLRDAGIYCYNIKEGRDNGGKTKKRD